MDRRLVVVLALALTLAVNYLANALPLGGQSTGEISDSFPVLFTPAGYVFAVWGAIYLGLIAYAVYQALPTQRGNARVHAAAPWFVASCLFNAGWIVAWHYGGLGLSLALMLGLLLSLVGAYRTLAVGRYPAKGAELWAVDLPFSVYLGWITVASVANASVVLYASGWDRWGLPEAAWAVVMISAAGLIGLLMLGMRRDLAFAGVLVWAFVGIAVRQWGTPPVSLAAALWALVLALALLRRAARPRARALPIPEV